MNWNAKYALLIGISTISTWLSGLLVKKFIKYGRMILAICILINLGILIFFKYFNFLIINANLVLEKLGFKLVSNPYDIMLPVGISFYTFQAIGYIIDVYRKEIEPEKNLFKYALFVSFFPQLVAGPIERSKNLLIQIQQIPDKAKLQYNRITNGLIYMLYGLFLKMVVSDRIALMVDTVFPKYRMYGGVELIVAAVGFSIQIYCDFSSYSTIAIGASEVLGIKLMENFETPYFSASIKEFWQRWHISLSSWLRDYIYIPLGGNRNGKVRKNINLLVTFLISGFWHGANWNYVVWGGYHALCQIIGESTKKIRRKIYQTIGFNIHSISFKIYSIILTFILVTIGWVFFRVENVSMAIEYLCGIITRWNPWAISDGTLWKIGLQHYEWMILIISMVIMFLVDLVRYKGKKRIDIFLEEQGTITKGMFITIMVLAIYVYGQYGAGYDAKQFIYFQF